MSALVEGAEEESKADKEEADGESSVVDDEETRMDDETAEADDGAGNGLQLDEEGEGGDEPEADEIDGGETPVAPAPDPRLWTKDQNELTALCSTLEGALLLAESFQSSACPVTRNLRQGGNRSLKAYTDLSEDLELLMPKLVDLQQGVVAPATRFDGFRVHLCQIAPNGAAHLICPKDGCHAKVLPSQWMTLPADGENLSADDQEGYFMPPRTPAARKVEIKRGLRAMPRFVCPKPPAGCGLRFDVGIGLGKHILHCAGTPRQDGEGNGNKDDENGKGSESEDDKSNGPPTGAKCTFSDMTDEQKGSFWNIISYFIYRLRHTINFIARQKLGFSWARQR